MLGKIVFEKYPAPPDLGARNLSALGTLAQFLGMKAKELSRLAEIECAHDYGDDVRCSGNEAIVWESKIEDTEDSGHRGP